MVYHIEIAGKGGITQYTYNLVSHLNKINNKQEIAVVSAKHYELQDLVKNYRVLHLFNRFKTNPFKVFNFFVFTVKNKDIVHFQLSAFPFFILNLILLLKIFKKTRIVVTAHNVISHESHFLTKKILAAIYKQADMLIVHAGQNRKYLLELFSFPAEKVWLIPHGNYEFAGKGNPKERPRKNKKHFELLFFGFIREYKGLDNLIHALKIIKEKHADILLQIAGQPKEPFSKYEQLIDKLNLKENIKTHLDYIEVGQIAEFLSSADVVILPYKRISQSGIVFLAYAFAKPVIATRVGGLPEAVEHGKSGYIVEADNPGELAEAVIKLIENPQLLREFGAYAAKLSQTKYSWTAIAQKTIQLYNALQGNNLPLP